MSGSLTTPSQNGSTFATGAFSDAEKADVRRFCGYPTYGDGAQGFQSWRFFRWYGVLEFRMNNLALAEYANVRFLLQELSATETLLFTGKVNLGTDEAAIWKRNRDEVRDRWADFNAKRFYLCQLVGVPPGEGLVGRAGGQGIVV